VPVAVNMLLSVSVDVGDEETTTLMVAVSTMVAVRDCVSVTSNVAVIVTALVLDIWLRDALTVSFSVKVIAAVDVVVGVSCDRDAVGESTNVSVLLGRIVRDVYDGDLDSVNVCVTVHEGDVVAVGVTDLVGVPEADAVSEAVDVGVKDLDGLVDVVAEEEIELDGDAVEEGLTVVVGEPLTVAVGVPVGDIRVREIDSSDVSDSTNVLRVRDTLWDIENDTDRVCVDDVDGELEPELVGDAVPVGL
jgi:hypothetical protein